MVESAVAVWDIVVKLFFEQESTCAFLEGGGSETGFDGRCIKLDLGAHHARNR